jgi:hypothetical protein
MYNRPSGAARHSPDPIRRLKAVPTLTWGVREGARDEAKDKARAVRGIPLACQNGQDRMVLLQFYIAHDCWLGEGGEFLPGAT